MSTPTLPLDPVRASLDRSLHALAGLGGDLIAHANRIGAILWSPPRVVIVGRLKAGKSTLVNALIGAPVAETAALEATRLVAVYQDGAPSRAEVVGLDGTRRPIDLVRGQPADLGVPATDIAYIHRYLPSAAIRDVTLVDTPGLATLTTANETATRRVLIDGFEQTRTASVDADAAVFLFDSSPRADEVAFLKQLGFTPLNTLGVLSRADGFGEGALGQRNPIEHAHQHARTLAAQLADTVMTVVPISGLMAETSHTGALTEVDARTLAELGGFAPFDLIDLIESDDTRYLTAQQRDRLVDLLGEYGIIHGRQIAARGAAALNEWLADNSGIRPLRQILHNSVAEFASVHRAQRILLELKNLAYSHPARDHIRGIVHQVREDPAMQPIVLFVALRSMLEADPRSPVAAELRRLLQGRTVAEKLGLPPEAPIQQVRAEARTKLSWAQGQALSTMTAADDAALVTLIRTYNTLSQ
ncbi:GTPase [Rhodococcus koreensis]|uniref:50S ribosome-binding GTPase n=1 Tax=Rhodococcus koreensis TaxID=99653 RepID=A0A1H4IH97_9NOCA|nr:GTPase [Rhodococcus koreensis]SEB33494.1 50S ribosome-binding GTPase [Rhodococcus koreensis]